jgi:hypothetical protein
MPPPVAPEPRKALAGRIRRLFGWIGIIVACIAALMFLLEYHIVVRADGWLEIRPGPSWMDSLMPRGLGGSQQLAIAIGDLAKPARTWDGAQIDHHARFLSGSVGGLRTHQIEGRENWEFKLWPELSKEAQRRVNFALGREQLLVLCQAQDEKRDRDRDYQMALEATALDRGRSCGPDYLLDQAPNVSELYSLANPSTIADFGLFDLSNSAIRMYLYGLALAYRDLPDVDRRRRALETAVLLTSYRAKNQVPTTDDWLAFIEFLDVVAASPRLPSNTGDPFPRLSHCATSWCELAAKLTKYFAVEPASGVGNGTDLMAWLLGRDAERQAIEGDATHAWSLPALLLLARHGDLRDQDFDLIIRFFKFIVPNSDQVWIDTTWLPRFARLLRLGPAWRNGLWKCAFQQTGSGYLCSSFDADLAANVLAAQARFLTSDERRSLVSHLDSKIPNDRDIALFASQMTDLACWSEIPERWLNGLEGAIDYQIQIEAPRTIDPLTGVTIVEVTDVSVAQALAAATLAEHGSPRSNMLLLKYAANHWDYAGLEPVYRALAASLDDAADSSHAIDPKKTLAALSSDARARIVLLQAMSSRVVDGLLLDRVVSAGPPYWKLDALIAARRQIADFSFDLDAFCPRQSATSATP